MSYQCIGHLMWPDGWGETPAQSRKVSAFGYDTIYQRSTEIAEEVKRFKGSNLRITCNAPLRATKTGYAGFREPQGKAESQLVSEEPGCAIYFDRNGKPMTVGCDQYVDLQSNMRAITLTLGAIRGIERWGSSELLERSVAGFAELPAPGAIVNADRPFWAVLAIAPDASLDVAEAVYRSLVKKHHPDVGGDPSRFLEIQAAIVQAREVLKS